MRRGFPTKSVGTQKARKLRAYEQAALPERH
jgi:hypothetical protein